MIAERQTHAQTNTLPYRGGVISELKLKEMKRQEQLELRAVH